MEGAHLRFIRVDRPIPGGPVSGRRAPGGGRGPAGRRGQNWSDQVNRGSTRPHARATAPRTTLADRLSTAAHAAPGITWTRTLVMESLAMTARAFGHLVEPASGCRTISASSAFVYTPSRELVHKISPLSLIQPYAYTKVYAYYQLINHGLFACNGIRKLVQKEPVLRETGHAKAPRAG